MVFLDEWKTIKEDIKNINILEQINIKLDNDLYILNTDYKLKSFLRKDLSNIELKKIKIIVSEYNTNKWKLDLILIEKAKDLLPIIDERKLLLEEKRKLYSGLIPYINTDFRKQYLEYIKWDAKIFNEQNDVTTDIIGKKEILSHKLETIETKIQEHKDFINESIERVVETRLDDKINNLNNNERFKILNTESKIKVLDKTINKIEIKLQNLIDVNWNTKTIQIYYIALSKLNLFKDWLK